MFKCILYLSNARIEVEGIKSRKVECHLRKGSDWSW